jgi:aspartate/methionine/tyrosine aminotransferase
MEIEMQIAPFKLERYFAQHEFKAKILMSSSDCESLSINELLEMAGQESKAQWSTLKLGYTETQGHPLLREEISRLYETISADQIMIAAPEEAIFIAMQTVLRPNDHVIVLAPAYQSLYEIAASIGCTVTRWMLQPTASGWQVDINQLEKAITPLTRLLVLNIPNNPTGFLTSRQEFDDILQVAQKHSLLVFSDEMYRLLEHDPRDRLPSICDVYDKGISLSGLSKSMALPGLRIGWLATTEKSLMDFWMAYKDYTTICNSAPSEILGLIALQNKSTIISRNMEIIHANLEIASHFLESYTDLFSCSKPDAGSIMFPAWFGTGSVEEFCQQVLDRLEIMIVPGSMFDYPGNHFRLGLGRKNFSQGIELLDKYINLQK